MASEFIASDTGNWNLYGANYTVQNMGHMYDGAVLRADAVTPFETYVEYSVSGLDSGDYRISYWWGDNSQSRDCKVTVTDGSSSYSDEIIMIRNRNQNAYVNSLSTWPYGGGNLWHEFAVGIKCQTGTLNFKVEPEPRMRYTGTWDAPRIAGQIIPSLDQTPDTDPEHTPVSTKSKPHPLSTN